MSLDEDRELGKVIGGIISSQSETNENLSPDESENQDIIVANFSTNMSGSIQLIKKPYASDSFILDHPVYGELDSAVLKLDGGYATIAGSPTFPATFPWVFADETIATEILYSETF